jgi:hypothetical protein
MKSRTLIAVLAVLAASGVPVATPAADAKLFSMRMGTRSEANPENPRLNYTVSFTEVERTEATSILEIIYMPARYPDQGDLTRGMCFLLKARGEKFMLATLRLVSQEPLREEVSFVKSAPDGDDTQLLRAGIISLSHCEKSWLPRQQAAPR